MSTFTGRIAQPESASTLVAFYDPSQPALQIVDLAVTDPTVLMEARRWSTGQRGAIADDNDLKTAELSAFVEHALAAGARGIAAAGDVQDTHHFDQLVTDVGERAAKSATAAAEAMAKAVAHAQEEVLRAQKQTRRDFAEQARLHREGLHAELNRILGGEQPELMERLRPVVDKFGDNLQTSSERRMQELFDRATHQFNPDNPTSPMAKHARLVEKQQAELKAAMDSGHRQLEAKLGDLITAIKEGQAAKNGASEAVNRSNLKGQPYEDAVHAVMHRIAAGLGDEYHETGTLGGRTSTRCKKGDGVLSIAGGQSAVVVEMTHERQRNWNDYLESAEVNREASASIGLVPRSELLRGESCLIIGPRRVVVAFDPDTDDPGVLRTVVQLVRLAAIAAQARLGSDSIERADEKLGEALALVPQLLALQKLATSIHGDANKIIVQVGSLRERLERILTEGRDALAGAGSAVVLADAA